MCSRFCRRLLFHQHLRCSARRAVQPGELFKFGSQISSLVVGLIAVFAFKSRDPTSCKKHEKTIRKLERTRVSEFSLRAAACSAGLSRRPRHTGRAAELQGAWVRTSEEFSSNLQSTFHGTLLSIGEYPHVVVMQRSKFHSVGKQELDGSFVFVRVRFCRHGYASLRSSRRSILLGSFWSLGGHKSALETE